MNISLLSLWLLLCCLFMIKFNMNWKNWDFCICKVGDCSQLATWSVVSLNQQHGHYLQVFQKFRISGQPQDLLNQTLYFNKIFGWFFFLLKFEKYCALMFLKVQFLHLCIWMMLETHITKLHPDWTHCEPDSSVTSFHFIIIIFPNTERHR